MNNRDLDEEAEPVEVMWVTQGDAAREGEVGDESSIAADPLSVPGHRTYQRR